jgi:flagellar L-ring protein precursor FlgH
MFTGGTPGFRGAMTFFLLGVLLASSAALTGCASTVEAPQVSQGVDQMPRTSSMIAPPGVPDVPAEGTLWREDGQMLSLFVTPKARDIGNILTVKIVESSSAKNSATTKTGRNSTISGGIDEFFTLEKYITPYTQVSGSFDSEFEGDGSTDRSGKLKATITVRVVDVLPDGNLRIAGSREIAVNNERQFITLTGFVRPEDVDYTNTVLSTYISDARIVYSGSGIVNDRQRPGWMMRTLDAIWPF